MAGSSVDLALDAKLLQAARDDWAERMTGRTYKSPLPPDQKPDLEQLGKEH
jgi:hypothetical protein